MSRFRSQDYIDGYFTGLGSGVITAFVIFVLLSLFGCGSIVEPPAPCTLEAAKWVQYDDRGRAVMFSCDYPGSGR